MSQQLAGSSSSTRGSRGGSAVNAGVGAGAGASVVTNARTDGQRERYLAEVQRNVLSSASSKSEPAKKKKSNRKAANSRGRGAKKRNVELPSAKSLTPASIVGLLFQSRATKASLKTLSKTGLALKGVKRGQIPVLHLAEDGHLAESTRNETKMLSRCSAEEIGAYLVLLLSS